MVLNFSFIQSLKGKLENTLNNVLIAYFTTNNNIYGSDVEEARKIWFEYQEKNYQ